MGTLNKHYTIIKNNLPTIALIPTLLGGCWQLYKLGSISPGMIAFFSISQLFADGFLILIYFIFPSFVFWSIFIRIRIDNPQADKLRDRMLKLLVLLGTAATFLCLSLLIAKIALTRELRNLSSF